MIDLPIGTRFYYEGRLCEVVKMEPGFCEKCIMCSDDCNMMACTSMSRKDNTEICFKWVEDQEENDEVK